MILELNQVLIEGEARTLSMIAETGRMTCITGGTAERRSRWLLALLGFEPVCQGYVSIDGEPLTARTADDFRSQMSYSPRMLSAIGEVHVYEPPSVQDVFHLAANRDLPISNGILAEEMRRIMAHGLSDGAPLPESEVGRVRLLAVASLLSKPIMLVDTPPDFSASYLHRQAAGGKLVVVASVDKALLAASDVVVELT